MISVEILDRNTLLVKFHETMNCVSSTVYGGGISRLRYVIFRRVSKNFNAPNPQRYALKVIQEANLSPQETAVFLTAVDVVNNYLVLRSERMPTVEAVMTVGLSPLACIGNDLQFKTREKGTINILLSIDECLLLKAAIELVMLMGSAKTAALSDLGITCRDYKRPYGTVTDAVIVAFKSKACKRKVKYAGAATPIGSEAVKIVYEGIVNKALALLPEDILLKRTTGMDINNLVEMALSFYKNAPVPQISEERVRNLIESELKDLLKDPNIWLLLRAAGALTLYASSGTVPGLSKNEYFSDTKKIVADELLGIALSTYINGWKGMFNYYWIDRIKERNSRFRGLPMFIDDIIGALLGGILSRVYDVLLKKVQ